MPAAIPKPPRPPLALPDSIPAPSRTAPLKHGQCMEGTLGFWYRFYSGPRGKFQFGTQYSYVTRETWSGVAGPGTSGSPSGLDNMVYTSFRYYLP